MRTRFALATALAASLFLVSGPARAASSGMVPRGRPAWVTLAQPVAVVAPGTGGAGAVSITEGETGFPVAVTESGATGGAGAAPGGDCVALKVHGQQVAAGKAGDHGRFALVGAVPAGAVATVRWAPCTGNTDQRDCHNGQVHAGNPNRDEARSDGQGCSGAGDAGPRS